MVDFTNPNLLGASLDLNNLLSKLSSSSALIESLLDASAAAAAAALGANQNVLSGLMSKLQTIEIPTLPKLNLQAEIASIASLVPGSSSFIQSFAKIESEFGGDLTAKGLELASLVNNASDAILGGNSISSIVPNLVKEAGNSILAAVEIPDAVSRTIGVAVPEVLSTVNQNKAILARIKNTASLASATDVVASVAEEILISAAGGETVKVVPPGTGANVTPAGTVFTHKKGSNYDADIWSA